jgi:hypothetical protein
MNEKLKKAYARVKLEITEHPLPYVWIAGVTAGAISFYVGSTWKRDLLDLPHDVQQSLVDGGRDGITYMTKRGTFHVLPTRLFNQ